MLNSVWLRFYTKSCTVYYLRYDSLDAPVAKLDPTGKDIVTHLYSDIPLRNLLKDTMWTVCDEPVFKTPDSVIKQVGPFRLDGRWLRDPDGAALCVEGILDTFGFTPKYGVDHWLNVYNDKVPGSVRLSYDSAFGKIANGVRINGIYEALTSTVRMWLASNLKSDTVYYITLTMKG